jgi:hypothetical protein
MKALYLFMGSLALGGCAVQATESADESAAADSVQVPSAPSGVFKMYEDPAHVPAATCDFYDSLRLTPTSTGVEAVLIASIDGDCSVALRAQPRVFALHESSTEPCGARVYQGDGDNGAHLQLVDARAPGCVAKARFVIEETGPSSAAGPTTRLQFSFDPASGGCAAHADATSCYADVACRAVWGGMNCAPGVACPAIAVYKKCVAK